MVFTSPVALGVAGAKSVKLNSYRRRSRGNNNVTLPDIAFGRWGKSRKPRKEPRQATLYPHLQYTRGQARVKHRLIWE